MTDITPRRNATKTQCVLASDPLDTFEKRYFGSPPDKSGEKKRRRGGDVYWAHVYRTGIVIVGLCAWHPVVTSAMRANGCTPSEDTVDRCCWLRSACSAKHQHGDRTETSFRLRWNLPGGDQEKEPQAKVLNCAVCGEASGITVVSNGAGVKPKERVRKGELLASIDEWRIVTPCSATLVERNGDGLTNALSPFATCSECNHSAICDQHCTSDSAWLVILQVDKRNVSALLASLNSQPIY